MSNYAIVLFIVGNSCVTMFYLTLVLMFSYEYFGITPSVLVRFLNQSSHS